MRKRFFEQYHGAYVFEEYYNINTVKDAMLHRKPNIMMGCFAFLPGGGETFPISLANELKRRGYPVSLFNYSGIIEDERIRNRLLKNIPVVPKSDVLCLIEAYGVDIFHTHHASVDALVADARLHSNSFRQVVTMHGMYETFEIFSPHILKLLMGVDEWVYIARKNIIPFRRYGLLPERHLTQILNAIEPKAVHPEDRTKYAIPQDAFLLCIASRGIPQKGWKEAIVSTARARELSGKDIHIMLIGNGPVYEELKEAVPTFVHLMGVQDRVLDFLSMADLVLVPSTFRGESVPLVILEGFLVGIPAFATNLGEIPSMLERGGRKAGELIPFTLEGAVDVETFAHQLARVASDHIYYTCLKENVAFISEKFDFTTMVDRYIDVYTKASLS